MTQLAYILAASHSGSTLLAMLLGSHPAICTAGELKATALGNPEKYRCSCQLLIGACPFWRGISRRMEAKGFHYDVRHAQIDFRSGASNFQKVLLRPLHRGPFLEWCRDTALAMSPGWSKRLASLQARNAALVAALAEERQALIVVDSSKIGQRLKFLLRNPNLDIKIVRLIRDGRGVALAYTDPEVFADAERPDLRGGGSGATRESERLTMAKAAREWRRSNEEASAILRRIPSWRWMEVRYEELCTRPTETLSGVFDWLGVDPARLITEFRAVGHHVVGNGMRLDSTSEIRLDDRWRTALSPAALSEFNRVAGAMNRNLGYTD